MRVGQFAQYKGFVGSIEFDPEDGIYFGEILEIRDFVNYQGNNIIELDKSFREAVDDYLEIKKEIEKR